MKIKTLLSPLNVDDLYFTNKTTVVIDVLRATTTIVTALNNGAKEIIPVGSIEFAIKISGDAFSSLTLLAGERNTKKIEGFALGNSPLEFSNEIVNGKSIVLFTTNGSKAIVKAKYSSRLFITSFLNSASVAKKVNDSEELNILCSGNNGLFSFEDSACAGDLIDEILQINENVELDDASKTCHMLFQKNKRSLRKMLSETEHGKKLIEQGFKDDIKYAAQKNIIDLVPQFGKGSIKLSN
ncbi:MAG: 2-phosphosulfolactate phosphatase [Ignavibacteriae bacterium]|nr:2-phosphosulfolactate phosphatase [Ignavibacteriota bacterium]MCB9206821.1 2-phosphosulfolactate phosphatase [Ignavibacteriales bacterium]MCB9210171.1 2-phosphosulfolactate phosphatase [Ignavibacteriales bacterium]MCB9259550.1 2-phosphosulfolactate phosphatase [Ignavibacteriales bacterium]